MSPSALDPDVLDDPLTTALAEHMQHEETALTGLLHSVQEVRSVLLQNNADRLAECLSRQTDAFAATEAVRASRHRLTPHSTRPAAPL